MKSKVMNYILNGVLSCLIIVLIISLCVSFQKEDDKTVSAAGEANMLVANNGNISIYVSGNHIDNLQSSKFLTFGTTSHFFSEYYTQELNDINLSAVSENKLFSRWRIFDSDNYNTDLCSTLGVNPTNERVNFTYPDNLSGQLVVVAEYKNNIDAADYGKYFFDPFFLDDADDFEHLAKIVNNYNESTEEDFEAFKLTKSTANRTLLLNGYFKITKSLTLNDSFTSIGTKDNPFLGKIDGSNNGEIAIISLNQIFEVNTATRTGDYYGGLFGAISESNANDVTLIRNIRMQGIISVIERTATSCDNAYIGGFAGISGHGVLVDSCESKVDISVDVFNVDVYAGGFFGYSYAAIDQNRNLRVEAEHKNWSVSTQSTDTNKGNIYLGGYAGYLSNSYIYGFDVICDQFSSNATAIENGDVYHGGIVGKMCHTTSATNPFDKIVFEDLDHVHFTNAHVICSDSISISGQSNNGDVYVGGLIGEINALDYEVTMANISFEASTLHNSLLGADTRDANSNGDVYLGGIVAHINGYNATYDERYITEFKPLFTGNISMEARQKGKSNSTKGKAVGGVFVGLGYINVNDTQIFLNSAESQIKLNVVQDKFSVNTDFSSSNSDPTSIFEHISAGIFAGSFGTASLNSYPISNFVLIANNVTVNGIREEGAKSLGQITVGGLVGFSNRLNIDNVKMLYNNCNLYIESLSYELKVTTELGNNAYLGGVIGRYAGSGSGMVKMSNTMIAGYDYPEINKYVYDENNIINAVSEINGLQNTQAGGSDYKGEIYVGGLIGCTIYASVTNCEYRGTSPEQNKVILRGNNNVDSAMIGGIIGLVRSQSTGTDCTITYCNTSNVHVLVEASCETVSNPDTYVGGTIGAVFMDQKGSQDDVSISNCSTHNSIIQGIGHQDMKTYVGGILGGACWNKRATVSNCVSYNNRILGSVDERSRDTHTPRSYCGGIAGFSETSSNITIKNCASVGDYIEASVAFDEKNASTGYAGGIFGKTNTTNDVSVTNSYVNSTIKAKTTVGFIGNSITNSNSNYYNATNMTQDKLNLANDQFTTNSATGVTFADKTGINNNDSAALYTQTLDTNSVTNNNNLPYVKVTMSNPTVFSSYLQNNAWYYRANNNGIKGTSYAYLWVKIIENDTTDPSYANGWVRLGTTKLVMTGAQTNSLVTTYENISDDYIISEGTTDTITVNLRSDMESLSFNIAAFDNASNTLTNMEIYESFNISALEKSSLGLFNFINNPDGSKTVTYYPTTEYFESNQKMFTITFTSGTATKNVNFIVNANTIEKMQGRYSDTTLPLNYLSEDASTPVGSYTLGTAANPYIYYDNTTVKIIPALNRLNEGDVISDLSVQYVTYTVTRLNEDYTRDLVIKPSGELVIGDIANTTDYPYINYRVDIKLLDKYNNKNLESSSVYITVLDSRTIGTILKGANYEGPIALGYYNSNYEYDFTFDLIPKSGFSGIPEEVIIEIGDDSYDLLDGVNVSVNDLDVTTTLTDLIIQRLDDGTIIKQKDEATFYWEPSTAGYRFILPSNHLTENVEIHATYNPVYTILFDVNLDFEGIDDTNRYLSVSATSDYTIASLIGATRTSSVVDGKTVYTYSIADSILKKFDKLAPFGYSLHGWYLIEDASYVASYGRSIEELLGNYASKNNGKELFLNGNYTFYARWSFSIFLNEAPGTTIKCSFPETFLYRDEYNVDVPINNKKGFSFTIIKSETFAGEADVNAHVLLRDVDPNTDDEYILREVTVQKYHDDMYVYTVAPEDINGVLIITTFSCDSEFIVGENTESVDEDIVPEDGVFTVKYVVNHLENKELKRQSFAYAQENIVLQKKLKLTFERIKNLDTNEREPYNLPIGTEIKLYYILDETTTTVGYYKLTSPTSSIYATDFKIINTSTPMFSSTETFEQFFGAKSSKSEGYYFVVTPPNGYDSNLIADNSYFDCIATIGYVNEDETEYLSADRYTFDGTEANKPPYYNEMKTAPSNLLRDESKHESEFIVYNSRETYLENTDSHIFNVIDGYKTINVDGINYVNPGDWRHQNKYLSLGVQIYINETTKEPINLSGLTVNIYKDNVSIHDETISLKLPKNAVYTQILGTGEYFVEVIVDDATLAANTSGFTSSTPYGATVLLLESTSNVKPALGTVRTMITKTMTHMGSLAVFNLINELTFNDHLVAATSINDGVIANKASLKTSIDLTDPNYDLIVTNYSIAEGKRAMARTLNPNIMIKNNIIYGWTEQKDIDITATYKLVHKTTGQEFIKSRTYKVDKDDNWLSIAPDSAIVAKLNSIDSYISSLQVGNNENDIIVFNVDELNHGLTDVKWVGDELINSALINNNGVLSANDEPIVTDNTIYSDSINLVYTLSDGTNRSYTKTLNIYRASTQMIKFTTNFDNPINATSGSVTSNVSINIGTTGKKMNFVVKFNWNKSNDYNYWTYNKNNGYYECTSTNKDFILELEFEFLNDNNSVLTVDDFNSNFNVEFSSYINEGSKKVSYSGLTGSISCKSDNTWGFMQTYTRTVTVITVSCIYYMNWNRQMIS